MRPTVSPARRGAPGPRGNTRPFTLIEMLVVVAVISILAALLAPALRRALDQAKDLTCVNNLHQIGIAAQTYANDNPGGRMPQAWQKTPRWCWQDVLAAYCGVTTGPVETECFAETHLLGEKQVKRGKGPFSCPVLTDTWVVNKDATDSTINYLSSLTLDYGMNLHVSGAPLARMRRPGRTFAFMDMFAPPLTQNRAASAHLFTFGRDCYGEQWPMFDYALPRHRGETCSNIVYADGHTGTHVMPVMVNWNFRGGGDILRTCQQQDYKAGIWWHKYPHN